MTVPVNCQAVRTKPRYRARILRDLMLRMMERKDGESLSEVAEEFWALYDFRPRNNQLACQVHILMRDKLIERVGFGVYRRIGGATYQRKRARPPAMPARADGATVTAITPSTVQVGPAAHAPAAPSIFD